MIALITLALLGGHGAVIAPASDGGFWLVDRQGDQLWLAGEGGLSALQVDGWPQAVALDSRANPLVTCREANTLVRLSPDGGLDRLPLPGGPGPLATTSRGTLAVVGLHDVAKVVLVDVDAWTVARAVDLPSAPADVVIVEGWAYALLAEGGGLVRFELEGDGGVTQVLAATPRGRGIQLAQRENEVVAITRATRDDVVIHEEGSVRDLGFVVTGTRVTTSWKYQRRVVPGGLTAGRASIVAFEDGTVAELGHQFSNTARDMRDQWRLEGLVAQGKRWVGFSPLQQAVVTIESRDVRYLSTNPGWVAVQQVRKLPESPRAKDLLRGERLFSIESSATSDYGFTCETCHPSGGVDGLRWRLKGRKVAVPTLAARQSARDATWLQRHAVLLGGQGFSASDVEALLRYLREGFRQRR